MIWRLSHSVKPLLLSDLVLRNRQIERHNSFKLLARFKTQAKS
jgi:hypothetical protein